MCSETWKVIWGCSTLLMKRHHRSCKIFWERKRTERPWLQHQHLAKQVASLLFCWEVLLGMVRTLFFQILVSTFPLSQLEAITWEVNLWVRRSLRHLLKVLKTVLVNCTEKQLINLSLCLESAQETEKCNYENLTTDRNAFLMRNALPTLKPIVEATSQEDKSCEYAELPERTESKAFAKISSNSKNEPKPQIEKETPSRSIFEGGSQEKEDSGDVVSPKGKNKFAKCSKKETKTGKPQNVNVYRDEAPG